MAHGQGPLRGVKILEFAGLGPGPFAAMLLSDMGAEVVRIDRKGVAAPSKFEIYRRGRREIGLDLKHQRGIEAALHLIAGADALIEGFRPGVMERLGLGPDICFMRNPRLVYGRMTGWGQSGPLAERAGHDINYIALSGALGAIGAAGGPPIVPLNLVGDFGGGALYLAMGILAAIIEAKSSGHGQIVDAAMTDGAANLMSVFYGLKAAGLWRTERGVNALDGGAHFYGVYETADGKFVSVGALEPQFYRELCERIGAKGAEFEAQYDRAKWPDLKAKFAAIFRQKTRAEWEQIFSGSDACFAPVLSMEEAPGHPHNAGRGTFLTRDGVVQPAPAPHFYRTHEAIQPSSAERGENFRRVLADWGFDNAEIEELVVAGVCG